MFNQNMLFEEETEEIPNEITEEMKQIIKVIDSFNIEELRNLVNGNRRQQIIRSRYLFRYMLNKIDEKLKQIVIEIQNNSIYDCSQILDFINEFIKRSYLFEDMFSSQEQLLKIIEYTDNLIIYEKVFQILTLSMIPRQEIQNNYFPRLIYLEKILYEHINYLSKNKIKLVDYYQDDPKYRDIRMDLRTPLQFDIEYNEPAQQEESYEDICKNKNHNNNILYDQFQNKIVQIVDDDSVSALNLSRNLLNKQNQPLSPLIEIVKYRILIKRGLEKNPQQTKNIIIKLHLKAFIMISDQRRLINGINAQQQIAKLFNSIIGDRNINYFDLFKLETIDPLLVTEVLETISINNQHLDQDNQFVKLLSDVLSMEQIAQDQVTQGYPLKYKPQILSENLVRDESLTCSIFSILSRNLFINRQFSQFDYNQIINKIIRPLNIQDNRMLFTPKQLEATVLFLSQLIRNYDPHLNNQRQDELTKIVEYYINQVFSLQKPTQNGYVQINETDADLIMNSCIRAINFQLNNNQFLIDGFQTNNNNIDNVNQLTKMIVDSHVLGYIANILQQPGQFTKTVRQALRLISYLLNANFQEIDKIVSSNLPDVLNEMILKMSTEEIDPELIMAIISFYANITKGEEINKFNDYAKVFLDRLINYHLIVQNNIDDQSFFNLAKFINDFNYINDKSRIYIHEILVKVLGQLLEELNNQQQNLSFNQDFESQFQKIQKKKTQTLLFHSELCNQENQSLCQYLRQQQYFNMLAKLFKIPNFDRFIIIQGFNSSQCLEKALQLIDEWERELGSTLEKVTFLHFNQKMLIENCSIQTYQIASRLSEILHYLSQLLFQNNNLVNNQNQSAKLIDKCCALLEIVLVTENENKNASIILFQILRQAIRQQQNNNNNLQPLSRLLIRLIIESNNHPTMTLQLLKKINNSFNQVNLDQNIEKIIIDSQFGNHLQDVIQNYILMINTDSSNTQLINQLGDEINKILEYLYRVPNILTQGTDLLVISKIISDIGSLIQITKNSSQENIKKIQIFLLQQANSISRPGFLKNFDGISQNRIHEQLMIQLEQMGYQSQLINNVLMENPRIRNAGQFIDFMTLNQQRLEVEGKLTQQSDELLIQQIKAQQESIRLQLKENIKLFSNFNNLIGLEIQLNLSEILSILQLSVQKQFNLSLQFQGVEIEMSNQPDYNLQSIILVLSLLYKQQIQQQRQQQQLEQQQQQQQQQQQEQLDSIAKELLKLLDVLLDQVADDLTIKAVNFILAVLSNLITKNQEYLNLILVGVQKTLDSNVQNHITFQICIEILVKVFQKNRSCINQFVQQMNGLQSVFKVKGDSYNHFISLSKLSLAIIYDKIIIRAQIEAQIKKTIFDQENKEEVQKTNQQLDLQHYQNENIYPICLQPAQYNIQPKEQYKISKNHPELQKLHKNNHQQEDVKYIMNLLFNESEENDYLILKNGIQLDTLNSINQNGNAIFQFNFKHKNETQTLLKLLIEQIIISYFENNEEQQYYRKMIFDVLQLLISKFPLLLPQLSRINCSQFLEKYKNKIGYQNSQLPTKISFVTLITRFIIPSKNFIFCICLDTIVLYKKQNNIVPFAYEIRRLIIKQLYSEISRSINSLNEKILSISDILVTLLQIKSVAKICILNIQEPQNSYNFIKIYIEGIKNCDINRYFNYRDQLFFMIKTLNILYQVATNLLLEKTEPVITNSLSVNQMELGIIGQINPIEINDQVFQNDQTYQRYQEYNSQNEQFQYYLQNWPFLSIKNSQLQVNADQQMEPDIHQMLNIPLIIDSQEIFDKELEEELNYWTDDVQYIIEEEPENNQNIDNSYNGFINGISDQLENQIYRTIKFQGLRFPYQFQISLQEFKQILPSQNNAQLMPNFNRWQLNLYQENINQLPNVIRNQLVPRLGMMDQLPNIFRNQLGPRLGMMNQLPNVNRIILGPRLGMMDQQLNLNRNQNQNFGNVQNQNINNNGVDDDEENEDMIDQINFEMGLGQNQRNNYDFQMEYGNQQQQQQPNNSPLRQNIQPQFLQIKNIVNSVLNNRKQTLKHLGKIDQQLIQFLLKFLYVDDNFGSNYDYINTLLISLGIKANFNNQIIQAAINTLKKTTQNQIQENADQQTFILSRNEIIRDFDYSSNFIQNKAFKLLLQLQSTSKQNISDENIKDFFGLLFKLKGNSLKQLLQFLANQEQKYQLTLAPEQVKMLYNFMIEQDDIQNSSNCMKFISNLWNVDKNAYKLMSYMKFQIISISEYYTNQFLNQQQVEQTFKQLNEVEKIFQMIYIASKDEQQLEQCRIFVNSNEIQDLFNILDQLISQIQNLHDCRYNQRLLPILKVFLICHQIIHPIANQNLQLLKVSSIEISQPEISQTESIGNLIDFERLFNILCQNGSEYINQIVKEQIYKMITYYRTIRQNQQRRNDYLFENDFLDGIFTYHPQVIKFQNKKDYFYQKQQINGRNQQQIFGGGRMLRIRREYIFEDSYIKIKSITDPNILKEQFEIIFEGEQGIDAGGLTKDWIYKLSEQIVDQKYKLFIPNSDNTCFIINRESSCDPDHLNKFKFVGKIFAIAILTKVPIYGQFPISMFKHIIGQKLSRADIQNYDEGLNNTFDLIYNQKIDSSWNLFWAYTIKQGGVPVDVELKPGGKDIEVTEYDKKDYVRKYCHQIMAKDIEDQIKAIQDGFYSLISKEDIKIFDSIQLELLLCGESNIDVEDLIRTLRYQGYTAQHQVIGWLKNILRSFNQDMLAKFLSLATGHPKLPVGGFQNPECRITIRLPNYQQNDIDSRLPTGHTCTRVLDLPAYSNEETLRKQLETALNEGGEGFDLA